MVTTSFVQQVRSLFPIFLCARAFCSFIAVTGGSCASFLGLCSPIASAVIAPIKNACLFFLCYLSARNLSVFSTHLLCFVSVPQLKLVNHPEDGHQEAARARSASPATGGDIPEKPIIPGSESLSSEHSDVFHGSAEAIGELRTVKNNGKSRLRETDDVVGEVGDGGENEVLENQGVGFGEAMIDEAEYTEDHHEEQRLFEDMKELLTVRRHRTGRNSREQGWL